MSYDRWMPVQYPTELYHHGVKGMRWGVRRYQDKWGRLTNAGRRRRDRLNDKADAAYTKGSIKKAGKLYAKAGLVGGESVEELEARYRRTASGFRKSEIQNRTEWQEKLSQYFDMPTDTSGQKKAREQVYDDIDVNVEGAERDSKMADKYERRYKALIAKYGDMQLDDIDKRWTALEEQQTRKQIDYLATRPHERKRLKRQLKEALEYENQPINKADKERMKGQYDDEGRPLLSDWPELTKSDEIKRRLKQIKTGF